MISATKARRVQATPHPPRLLRLAILLSVIVLLVPLAAILVYRFVNPPLSTLMARQWLAGVELQRQWVPLDRMSPHLIAAVVSSEDARFCVHRGIDWSAIESAIEDAEDGLPRGASTIPMQTAKNLFLWQGRSYVRKGIEMPLAYAMDFVWPKRRMLEIYLNVAEWGPGVFGAEAAARHHFRKSAIELTRAEAALLAAALPNPHVRNAGRPGPRTRRVAQGIQRRIPGAHGYLGCILNHS